MTTGPATVNMAEVVHAIATGDGWSPRRALFLTFGFDPAFFERGILGRCRYLGAAVTVIADARSWAPDPVALRSAGHEYLLGLAAAGTHSPRAFHPKLLLLQGPEGAMAAIGSGNLTLGGWQYNSELWRLTEATTSGASTIMASLADWLNELPEHAKLARPHRAAVEQYANELRQFLGQVPTIDSSARVLPLSRSIIDSLPEGPVDELTMTAPFLDPKAAAVEALLKRLKPRSATLILQDSRAVFSSDALSEVLRRADANVTVIADTSVRYRHAKLVEWRIGDRRWCLTGSANLSVSAMVAQSGYKNVELAVVEEVTAPVWPDATVDPTKLQTVGFDALPAPAAAADTVRVASRLPILQSVVWEGRDLEIELSRKSEFEIDLQARDHPLDGAWRPIGRVPAGVVIWRVSGVGVADGAQLRLLIHLPGEDAPTIGAPIPATDLDQATRPPVGGGRRRRIGTSEDLMSDDLGYLAAFGDQLAALAEERRATRRSTSPSGEHSGQEVSANQGPDASTDEVWWRWEQRARSLHGPAIAGFALGLPPAAAVGGWEDFREGAGELATDSALSSSDSEIATSDDAEQEPINHQRSAPSLKQKRRQWVRGYAENARDERIRHPDRSALSALSWLAVTRLSLVLYTAGNWPDDDETPARYLAELVGRLTATASPEDHRPEALALVAIIITAVRQRSDSSPTDPMVAAAERIEEEATDLLRDGDPTLGLITEYCRCVRTPAGFALDPAAVPARLTTVLRLGVIHAIELAEERGWMHEQRSERVLMIEGRMSHPDRAAANLLVGSPGPLAVVATSTDNGHRGLAIWAAPDLFTIAINPAPRWQHFTGAEVEMIVSSWANERLTRFRVAHGALRNPIPAAVHWLHQLGLADLYRMSR